MKSTPAFFINLHKALIIPLVLGLMIYFQNFSTEAWIYLALHGTYSMLWFLKQSWFPDKAFKKPIPFAKGFFTLFCVMLGYYAAPILLITRKIELSPVLIAISLFMYIIGIFFHFTSDIQKYYTLKYKEGLISEGMFAKTRNPNYFGEITMYYSLALLSFHWLPFMIITSFVLLVFLKIMKQKDQFLSQHPDFENYKKNTWLLLPKFF